MSGDDFEEWRAGILRDPTSADGRGCLLVLASVGVMLLGCLLTGAMLFSSKTLFRESRGVAFVLALPSIGLGIATFFLLAPVLYRRGSRGPDAGAPPVATTHVPTASIASAAATAGPEDDVARRLGLGGTVPAGAEELREVERDLGRLATAMDGAAAGATNLKSGRYRGTDIRVFDHMIARRDGSRVTHTVVAYAVPPGHEMEPMLQLPPGMFAEAKGGGGPKVLLLPAPRWMYYLIPGQFQRARNWSASPKIGQRFTARRSAPAELEELIAEAQAIARRPAQPDAQKLLAKSTNQYVSEGPSPD